MLQNMFGFNNQQDQMNQGFAPPLMMPQIGNMGYPDQNTPRGMNYMDNGNGQMMDGGFG